MSTSALFVLIALFFVTTVVGVVTGSNSLITVPVMFQFGIDEKRAIATNMFGLTFMAIGATIPFLRAGRIDMRRLSPLVIVTILGSAIGAALIGVITNAGIKLMVSVAMIVIVVFTLVRGDKDVPSAVLEPDAAAAREVAWRLTAVGMAVAFFLAIYGGLYSGGYVTVLTVAFVAFFGMTYGGAIAATKLINVFSSGIATLVFMWQGLVDYELGTILAVTMFAGAYAGAHFVTKMNDRLLRRIFLATVAVLAIKTFYDLI
jgi:uncharacterized protein